MIEAALAAAGIEVTWADPAAPYRAMLFTLLSWRIIALALIAGRLRG